VDLSPALGLAGLLGLIPGFMAFRKGHNFVLWWLFGSALFIFAVPLAMVLERKEPTQHLRAPARSQSDRGGNTAPPRTPLGASGAALRGAGKWGRYGRLPIVLLALVAFIDSVDRGVFNGVISLVKEDLGFSDTSIGFIGSMFIVMSFIATIPAGYMADRLRRTRVIAVVLGSWGLISALNAGVQNLWQFLLVRGALGVGETIDNPSSQSLIADYYPAMHRGRAYAYQRAAPTVGTAVGLALGGAVGGALGWRAAFLVVGVPGSILAIWIWRLQEPRRGESDEVAEGADGALLDVAARRGFGPLWSEMKVALRVRSLRALMIGTAISAGATSGFGFWAAAFYERHTRLSVGGAGGVVGAVILVGAVAGTILGGRAADRARRTDVGAPMRLAGIWQSIASVIFVTTFFPVPLYYRLPGQLVAVAFLVGAFPALTSMTTEVVPAAIRGIAFSVTGFLSAILSAASAPMIGAISDRFPIVVGGEEVGNLALAFAIVSPLILVGALVVLNGRRHVANDIEHVGDVAAKVGGRTVSLKSGRRRTS
jgi:MFS family permease